MSAPAAPPMSRTARRPARRLLVGALLVLLVAALVAAVPRLDDLGRTLAGVSWGWAAAAVAANVLSLLVRGLGWRVLLPGALGRADAGTVRAESAYAIGQLVNAVLPGRLGEPSKIAVYSRHLPDPGRDWGVVAGTVAAHRLLDVVPLAALTLLLALSTGLPPTAAGGLIGLLVATAALLVGALVIARRRGEAAEGGRLARLASAVRGGLVVLRHPVPVAVAVVLQGAGWVVEIAGVWFAFQAFGIDQGLGAAGLVVVATNAATLLPFWPGNVGVFQVAIALVLVPVGVPYGVGLAFGVGLQAIETASVLAVGVPAAAVEGVSLGALWRLPRTAPGAAPPR